MMRGSSSTENHGGSNSPKVIFMPPPQWGGLDLGSDNSGCARLGGSKVTPPLGVVEVKVVVVVVHFGS